MSKPVRILLACALCLGVALAILAALRAWLA
jgi:hypothetical protein